MPGEKILLLDTEKNVLLTYQAFLSDAGYQVNIASTFEEALQTIALNKYTVLLTELYIKGANTVNLIKQLKEDHPELYIIMLTAAPITPDNYDLIINAGLDDFFTKPLSPEFLLATIKKGINRSRLVAKNIFLEDKLKNINNLASPAINDAKGKTIHPITAFYKMLQNEIVRSQRYNHPFSLLLCEINDFKGENSHCLNSTNQVCRDTLLDVIATNTRKTDIITSYNGNFALILVETTKDGTRVCKSRLQKEIINSYDAQKVPREGTVENMEINYHAYPEQSYFITNWIDDS